MHSLTIFHQDEIRRQTQAAAAGSLRQLAINNAIKI